MTLTLRMLFLLSVVPIVLASCADSRPLELPEQEALTTAPDFAVVTPLYARIHEAASQSSRIVGHLRRGAIARVVTRSSFAEEIGGTLDFWYEVEAEAGQGWVYGGALSVYQRQARAERAAAELRERSE
ncbi:MAG: hypothetical protein ACOCRN_00265 [Spirochaetia bacterium]